MNAPFSPSCESQQETDNNPIESTDVVDETRKKVVETIVSTSQGYMKMGNEDNAEWVVVNVQKIGLRDGIEHVRIRYGSARVITIDVPASKVQMSAVERLEDGSLRMVKPF